MLHQGSRTTGGNIDGEISQKIDSLLDQLTVQIERIASSRHLRRAVVRSRLTCNVTIVLDDVSLFVLGEKASGMPSTMYLAEPGKTFSPNDAFIAARMDLGMEDPFMIVIPRKLIDLTSETREPDLRAIAEQHVSAENNRIQRMNSLISINPIFGPAAYPVDPHLCFVLMPFNDPLTRIYISIIKPTVEGYGNSLVCKRADEISSNRAVMQDIWKAICEARIVIADLTGLNPNVMYELGIAHTLGKETILVNQQSNDIKFPFDLAHIRRIEYEDTAAGGAALKSKLQETLGAIIGSRIIR